MFSPETLRYLEDLVTQQNFSAADPDFRSRVQLAVDALNELDAARVASVSAPSVSYDSPAAAESEQLSLFDATRESVYGGSR
jgi:hypothetical protein